MDRVQHACGPDRHLRCLSLSPLSKQKQSSTTATATTSSTNGKGQATVKLRLFPEGRWSRLEPYLTTTQDSPAQPRWHSRGLTMYLAAGPSSQSYKCQSSPTRTLIRVYQIIVLRASQTKHSYRRLLVPSAVPSFATSNVPSAFASSATSDVPGTSTPSAASDVERTSRSTHSFRKCDHLCLLLPLRATPRVLRLLPRSRSLSSHVPQANTSTPDTPPSSTTGSTCRTVNRFPSTARGVDYRPVSTYG